MHLRRQHGLHDYYDGCYSVDPAYNRFNPADVALTNTDNDTVGFTFTPTLVRRLKRVARRPSQLKLNSQPTANVTIGLVSSDPSEGTVNKASLPFTSLNWMTPQPVIVTGVPESIDDGNVAYTIITSAATSTDPTYNGLNPADVALTNVDDDTAGFTITPTTAQTTEAGGTATFTVKLTSLPTRNVNIPLSSSDLTEGTVSPATLVFTRANWKWPRPSP